MASLNITHTVSFHQSAFSDAAESAQIIEGATLREWLTDNVAGFDPGNPNLSYSQPLDMPVRSDVQIVYTPKGGVVGSIFKPIFKLLGLTPKKAKTVQTPQQGDDIEMSSVQANQAKYGEHVREIFGRYKVFPDYLSPPHRYFANEKDHWSEMLLCVGVGDHDVPLSEVRIGDTPIAAYGDRATVSVYQPNEIIPPGERDWWHSVPEVGGTRDGASGLPLRPSYLATAQAPMGVKVFSGTTIQSQGDPFPSNWNAGVKLDVTFERSYSVNGDRITGPLSGIVLGPGDTVVLGGDIGGTYTVNTVQEKTPASNGTPSILKGNSNFSLNYGESPAAFSLTVGRISAIFSLSTVFNNANNLISALNNQVSSSALSGMVVFSNASGKMVITEQAEYSGVNISVQNISNATSVFGDIAATNAAVIVGNAATFATPSSFTLMGFQEPAQNALLSIKKEGEYFELIGNTGSVITVQRRKANGDLDWSGFTEAFTSSGANIRLLDTEVEGGWQGWFDVQPATEESTAVEFDVFFPQGLIWNGRKGEIFNMSVTVVIELRRIGDTSAEISTNRTFSGTTTDAIGYTVRVYTPAAKWQARIKRTNYEKATPELTDAAKLFGLRSRINNRAPARYPNFTTMYVKIKGSEAASAEADEMISCIATRILNGSPSRDIADAVTYIARTQNIDTAALQSLQTLWQSRGDTFDFSYEKAHTIKQAANIALGAGFAEMTVRDGLLTPVRDQKRSTTIRAHSFSAQNTTAPIVRERDLLSDDETYGIDVEYMSGETWRVETVQCRAGLAGAKIEKLKLDGVTDRDRAWRYGMRELMRKRYQRETISTSTELDALNANYNDLAAFIEDVPQYGQSALITDVSGGSVRVTERIDWSAGADMVAVARDDKGRLGATVDISRIDDYTFLPSAAMGTLELYQTVFIGTRERIATIGVVKNVKPGGNSAKIAAVNYTDRIYDFDDAQADN